MSIVSSVTIPDAHVQADGYRRVRFEFTDHLGATHGHGPIPIFNVVTTPFSPEGHNLIYSEQANDALIWDGSMWQNYRTFSLEPLILQRLANIEVQQGIEDLAVGVDIFSQTAEHQTDIEWHKAVFDHFVVMEFFELAEYTPAIPHLTALTNPTITNDFGYVFQNFQNWSSDADTLKVAKDNFQTMAGVESS